MSTLILGHYIGVNHTQTTRPHLNSSMFQQGLSQSSAWKGHVRIGCSPDGTCGATAALERGYEIPPTQGSDERGYRITIKECQNFKVEKGGLTNKYYHPTTCKQWIRRR